MENGKEEVRHSLKAQDYIKIIKACKEAQVSEFKLGSLHIILTKREEDAPQPVELIVDRKKMSKTPKEIEMEELDELLLSNPVEYEARLAKLESEENE